ncbi:hypothetical protein GCK32_002008 [Trichostrongylus colubriformis]|uniref:Receptor L-domain domain-containing protein n=1 Tax=Trichostrongylus colubriformis TaxID=6319 RepID=A0AAN8FIP9_TRICO
MAYILHYVSSIALYAPLFAGVSTQGFDYDDPIDFECYRWGYAITVGETLWASHCDSVTGDIIFDSTSNFTEAQLETLFENITTINGKLRVEGTNFKRLNFLKTVVNMNTYYSSYVLEIKNNAYLAELNLAKLNFSNGMIAVQWNPLLDMSKYCTRLNKITNGYWMISGNKANCGGYTLDFPLTFTSILNVPSNLTAVRGDVIFEDTDKRRSALSIFENAYLGNLGLSKLSKISTYMPIEAQNNRILEVTFEEIETLVTTGVPATQFNGNFPTENLPSDICVFNSFTEDLIVLSGNCTSLLGLLYYRDRSFSPLERLILSRIRKIYGNIEMVNVDIEDLSMFSALEQVISLNYSHPAIVLESMNTLKTFKMPNLKLVYAPDTVKFAIDNCPNLNMTLSDCNEMDIISQNALSIDRKLCDTWFEDKEAQSEIF